MADLLTNYLDDILAQSMNGKRKYRITRADGTFEEVILEDVSEYEQVGSNFGASDINKTNQAVNEKFDSGDVVDPMLTTEEGFAADAYKTKLQFDEQNKKIDGYATDNASPTYLTAISATWCIFMGFAIVDVAFGVGSAFDSTDGEVNINSVPIAPKPHKYYYAPACSENGKNTNNCSIRLDPDGNLKAIGKFTEASTTYHASFMYKVV